MSKSSLNTLVDTTLEIEKLRVASEVAQTHLVRNGINRLGEKVTTSQLQKIMRPIKQAPSYAKAVSALRIHASLDAGIGINPENAVKMLDEERFLVYKRLVDDEEYIDGRISLLLKKHPAYPWFSRVKGIGLENIGKIIGLVRVAASDEFICPGKTVNDDEKMTPCRNAVEKDPAADNVAPVCPICGTQMIDPPYARTISGLWKYAGFDVIEGHAPKRMAGEKLTYNSQLRSMCWRTGSSLLRAKGKFYEYYVAEKEKYVQKFTNAGVKIVPAAKLPKKNGKSFEGDGFISEGHIHNMALRKMIKRFLAELWLVWRKAEGLPETMPYAIDQLGHDSFVSPEEMTDRD